MSLQTQTHITTSFGDSSRLGSLRSRKERYHGPKRSMIGIMMLQPSGRLARAAASCLESLGGCLPICSDSCTCILHAPLLKSFGVVRVGNCTGPEGTTAQAGLQAGPQACWYWTKERITTIVEPSREGTDLTARTTARKGSRR